MPDCAVYFTLRATSCTLPPTLRNTTIAGPPKRRDRLLAHRAREEAALAQALVQVGREEVHALELVGCDLDPDLLVLLPEVEESRQLLGVARGVGEGAQRARRRTGVRGRAAGRAGQSLRVGDRLRRRRGAHRGCHDRFLGRGVLHRRAAGQGKGRASASALLGSNLIVLLLQVTTVMPRLPFAGVLQPVVSSPRNEWGNAAAIVTSA